LIPFKERNKQTPVVAIHADGEADGNLVDAYVHSLDGPEALLSCVAKALDKSTGPQIAN
jgi:hypothetical protein